MIKVKFFIKGEELSGFSISGHAEFARQGKDIVCAAVSSAAYMAVNTVTDVIGQDASAQANDGNMQLVLNKSCDKCQAVLRGLELHLRELAREYPENIKVIYGGVKNA